MSPFKLMCKITGLGLLLAIAFPSYLFVTANSVEQQIAALVICALMILLSVAIGFYCACKYQLRREAQWGGNFPVRKTKRQAIHYPLHNEFKIRMVQVDKQVQKYQRRAY